MLLKNSLHLVLCRIVRTYPVRQGENSKETRVWRGGKGLAGLAGCQGLFLPWLLHLGSGRAGDFPLLQPERGCGCQAGAAPPELQHLGHLVCISGLLLEMRCSALPVQSSPQRTDTPGGTETPKMCQQWQRDELGVRGCTRGWNGSTGRDGQSWSREEPAQL